MELVILDLSIPSRPRGNQCHLPKIYEDGEKDHETLLPPSFYLSVFTLRPLLIPSRLLGCLISFADLLPSIPTVAPVFSFIRFKFHDCWSSLHPPHTLYPSLFIFMPCPPLKPSHFLGSLKSSTDLLPSIPFIILVSSVD